MPNIVTLQNVNKQLLQQYRVKQTLPFPRLESPLKQNRVALPSAGSLSVLSGSGVPDVVEAHLGKVRSWRKKKFLENIFVQRTLDGKGRESGIKVNGS